MEKPTLKRRESEKERAEEEEHEPIARSQLTSAEANIRTRTGSSVVLPDAGFVLLDTLVTGYQSTTFAFFPSRRVLFHVLLTVNSSAPVEATTTGERKTGLARFARNGKRRERQSAFAMRDIVGGAGSKNSSGLRPVHTTDTRGV